ncbi:MAG: hypothetical protein AAFX93_01790 [Verrucomicrobiota bacterium]
MKHFVNVSLLFFFATLAISGMLRFFQPFDLVVTRLHIVSGFALVIFITLHLSSRGKYFWGLIKKPRNRSKGKQGSPITLLGSVLIFWLYAVAASLWNWWPIPLLISASHESQHARDIFRPNRDTAYMPIDDGLKVKRINDQGASLRLEFDWGDSFGPDVDETDLWGDGHPQLAIWAESEDGTVLETLYVTEDSAMSNDQEFGGHQRNRNEVLPIWYERYQDIIGQEPEEDLDAVSSATPTRDFSLDGHLKMDAIPFVVYVEVNAPNDDNDFFHAGQIESNDGYTRPGIGQPSVIYEALIYPSDDRQYYLMDLTSHSGSSSVPPGELYYDTDQLTTAKRLVDKILLKVEWPPEEEAEIADE